MIINELNYPILKYVGLPSVLEHASFSKLFREPTEEEKKDNENVAQGRCFKVPTSPITRQAMSKFPIFSIDMSSSMTPAQFVSAFNVFNTFWSIGIYIDKSVPEIVSRKVWDDAYEFGSEDGSYNKWLKESIKKKKIFTGIMIRPQEEIAVMYYINLDKDDPIEISIGFYKSKCEHFGMNAIGYIDENLVFPAELKQVAAVRGVSEETAFHQEDIYNILKYIHYRENASLNSKLLHLHDKYRSDDICVDYYAEKPSKIMFK